MKENLKIYLKLIQRRCMINWKRMKYPSIIGSSGLRTRLTRWQYSIRSIMRWYKIERKLRVVSYLTLWEDLELRKRDWKLIIRRTSLKCLLLKQNRLNDWFSLVKTTYLKYIILFNLFLFNIYIIIKLINQLSYLLRMYT
jgi:hypothetical protein